MGSNYFDTPFLDAKRSKSPLLIRGLKDSIVGEDLLSRVNEKRTRYESLKKRTRDFSPIEKPTEP